MKRINHSLQKCITILTMLALFTSCNPGTMKSIEKGAHFLVFTFGAIVAIALIVTWINYAKEDKNDKVINELGCSGVIYIIAIIIFLIVLLS